MFKIWHYFLLFIAAMSLSAFGFAGEHEECPEGQVFDEDIGACINETNGTMDGGGEEAPPAPAPDEG